MIEGTWTNEGHTLEFKLNNELDYLIDIASNSVFYINKNDFIKNIIFMR